MKISLQLFLLSIIILIFSCKENIKNSVTPKTERQVEIQTSTELPKDSVVSKKSIETPKYYEHKYVVARSGLNYRDSPKGNVLGKFPLNTSLKILEKTTITDQIKDKEKTFKGEWVGVEKNSDTVYVFDGFLSNSYIESDIKLYNVIPYYKDNDSKERTAFLNLSETYFENAYNEGSDRNKNLILTKSDLSKDTIRLNQNQRRELLSQLKLSESDRIFVYMMANDSIINFSIKDLPAIACMNIYGAYSDYQNQEGDYEFGFDLGRSITNWEENLVFMGKENPFHTGKLKPMIWSKIDSQDFPKKFDDSIIDDRRKWWFKGIKAGQSYKFSLNNLDYYVQDLKKGESVEHRYLIVIDSNTKKVLHEKVFIDAESTYLIPLQIENSEEKYYGQWAGQLFKNKATVIFGFLGYTFGCPSITVLDETEPNIPILCDNRH
ncbi:MULTISPECIES: SH3 domain-containing protein [Mesonia]|uniref:Uncharacterized protein n=1 Tax=Mesonia oceanica TaxID=2687242 RepID=A0AC61YBY5_9FLAO|nr:MULTISPECIES: SH3 domain-containing protein [Mesonia]MAN29224.1 hypothetical protein [Mesonia sp.]MAQ39952.1 hypothetical protein [Mesonia sp.]MBJ99085.1 hypothetical protein [Flavobacteriaceae bacterium]VVV02002.1 hypothetical protein FVB9532_03297 [Mesonia oceanica]|tara:strand:- start:76457 stop:77761 length:1305 start_codon:yes stop_codon:yes gene_type:complete